MCQEGGGEPGRDAQRQNMARGRLRANRSCLAAGESAPHLARGGLSSRARATGEAPSSAPRRMGDPPVRCQRPNVLQIDRPPAPYAAQGELRPRSGSLMTRPRPIRGGGQGSIPVSLHLTAHVTAVIALDVRCDPHRRSLLARSSAFHATGLPGLVRTLAPLGWTASVRASSPAGRRRRPYYLLRQRRHGGLVLNHTKGGGI